MSFSSGQLRKLPSRIFYLPRQISSAACSTELHPGWSGCLGCRNLPQQRLSGGCRSSASRSPVTDAALAAATTAGLCNTVSRNRRNHFPPSNRPGIEWWRSQSKAPLAYPQPPSRKVGFMPQLTMSGLILPTPWKRLPSLISLLCGKEDV